MSDKYPIRDIDFAGVVFSVSPKIPFKNGEGSFRNAVLTVEGMYGNAYVPFLLFGDDANAIDEHAVGRSAKAVLRLSSRQYDDITGNHRWNIGFTCRSITLTPPETVDAGYRQQDTSLASDPDDIPF